MKNIPKNYEMKEMFGVRLTQHFIMLQELYTRDPGANFTQLWRNEVEEAR